MGDHAKQSEIFEFGTAAKADFIFLQETLVTRSEATDDFRKKWLGPSFWSPTLGKQGGVAILVSEKTNFDLTMEKRTLQAGSLVS